ncbi:MAG: hypothetical protein ACYTG5_15195 [Planctomycetota bacterium]|jgi:TolB-like protein
MNSIYNLVAMSAVISLSSACTMFPTPPKQIQVNHYLADKLDLDSVRRVMVLPFDEAPGVASQADMVRGTFIAEMSKLQSFEVVPLPREAREFDEIYHSLTRGTLSPDALAVLSERYGIDGVVMGTITNYRAYRPASLGLRIQLVSMHSGRTVWAADGIYDCGDAAVLEDLQHYAKSFAAAEDSLHGWRIHMLAPRKFATYVCHRIAGSAREATVTR